MGIFEKRKFVSITGINDETRIADGYRAIALCAMLGFKVEIKATRLPDRPNRVAASRFMVQVKSGSLSLFKREDTSLEELLAWHLVPYLEANYPSATQANDVYEGMLAYEQYIRGATRTDGARG